MNKTALARLLSSNLEYVSKNESEGRKYGIIWAEKYASFKQIKKISYINVSRGEEAAVCHSLGLDYQDTEKFWRRVCGKDWETKVNWYFEVGFLLGAQSVWKEFQAAADASFEEIEIRHT